MKVSVRQMGLGFVQQMQHPCNQCKGTGESISYKDRCNNCKGNKVVSEKKFLEAVVEKGMQNGQKIRFPGEADEAPDTVTGDVICVVQEKEHSVFKRKHDDLIVEHKLSLTEALCGFQFILTTLDGRQLLTRSKPGEVIRPDQFRAIDDEGMPVYQSPFTRGKLYVHFIVEFPGWLTLDQVRSLEEILPRRRESRLSEAEMEECEETNLVDVDYIEEEMRRKEEAEKKQEAYDEDDDDLHGGAPGVQCAQH